MWLGILAHKSIESSGPLLLLTFRLSMRGSRPDYPLRRARRVFTNNQRARYQSAKLLQNGAADGIRPLNLSSLRGQVDDVF